MTHASRKLFLAGLAVTGFLGSAVVCPPVGRAETAGDMAKIQAALEKLQARVASLEAENQKLRGMSAAAPRVEASSRPGFSAKSTSGSIGNFNPDLGVSADIVASLSQSDEDAEGNDKISVRELEIVIGHDVDPYSRFDATFTFSDYEDPSLEEAFLTYWGLPGGTRMWLGRFHPRVGKIIGLHRDQLATVDEPLAVQAYFGPEGLTRSGVEFANFLPLPWEAVTHELAVGILEGGVGEEATLLGDNRRHPTVYGHLKNFWEVSDTSSVELGGTYLLGSSDADKGYEVRLYGVDFTAEHYLDPIRKVTLQAEAYLQDRSAGYTNEEDVVAEVDGEGMLAPEFRDAPLGVFVQAQLRFADRWSVGTRWDFVEAVNRSEDEVRSNDQAWNGFLSFQQTEFSRWRFQYQHVDFAEGGGDDRFFFQGTFAIGTHKHRLS